MTTEKRMIWAVTSGEYSSYGVSALFELEADAQAAVAAGLGDTIEEMPYYPAGAPGPRRFAYWVASAECWLGTWADVSAMSLADWDSSTPHPDLRRPKVQVHTDARGKLRRVVVHASTEEQAVKACADRVAQLKAEQRGL